MAVDLPPDERTFQAALMAAALLADPATAANIQKLAEIEKLSAEPGADIVADDGSGTKDTPQQPDETAAHHGAPVDVVGQAASEPAPVAKEPGDTAAHAQSAAQSDTLASDSAPSVAVASDVISGTPVATDSGMAPHAESNVSLAAATPAPILLAQPQDGPPDTSNLVAHLNDFDDLANQSGANDLIAPLIELPGALVSGIVESVPQLIGNIGEAVGDLVTGLIDDIAIAPLQIVHSALGAVGEIGGALQSALLDNGLIEIPSLGGLGLDSLDGLAAAVEGSPVPALANDVIDIVDDGDGGGILPLIDDHVLDPLSHHLQHLL